MLAGNVEVQKRPANFDNGIVCSLKYQGDLVGLNTGQGSSETEQDITNEETVQPGHLKTEVEPERVGSVFYRLKHATVAGVDWVFGVRNGIDIFTECKGSRDIECCTVQGRLHINGTLFQLTSPNFAQLSRQVSGYTRRGLMKPPT